MVFWRFSKTFNPHRELGKSGCNRYRCLGYLGPGSPPIKWTIQKISRAYIFTNRTNGAYAFDGEVFNFNDVYLNWKMLDFT